MVLDLLQRIEQEEGYRSHLYQCSEGYWTIGIGYNIEERGLPDDIIRDLYMRDLESAIREAADLDVPDEFIADAPRFSVLVAMVFQMGLTRVRGFRNMLAAIREGDYEKAAEEMLDSRWARQTPGRANREANIMRTGRYNG